MKTNILKKSIGNALRGLTYVFKNEQNFRIQIVAVFFVIVAVFVFPLNKYEVVAIFLLILLILVLELINSTVELFIDVVKPRLHHQVKLIKDIMAGAVFIASLGSVAVGVLIFWSYFIEILENFWYNTIS